MQHVDRLGGERALVGLVHVGQRRQAKALADLGEDRQRRLEADAALAGPGGAVRLVERGLEDQADLQPRRDLLQRRGDLERMGAAFELAGTGDQGERQVGAEAAVAPAPAATMGLSGIFSGPRNHAAPLRASPQFLKPASGRYYVGQDGQATKDRNVEDLDRRRRQGAIFAIGRPRPQRQPSHNHQERALDRSRRLKRRIAVHDRSVRLAGRDFCWPPLCAAPISRPSGRQTDRLGSSLEFLVRCERAQNVSLHRTASRMELHDAVRLQQNFPLRCTASRICGAKALSSAR